MNYLPYIILFLMALVLSLAFVNYLRYNNVIAKGVIKTYEHSKRIEQLRAEEQQKVFKTWGVQEEKGFLKKIDSKIKQAGLKNIASFLTTDIVISLTIILTFLVGGICFIVSSSFILTVVVSASVPTIVYIIINIMADMNYKKAEKDLLLFIDLVHTYSMSSDDIIEILDTVSYQMSEPLRSNLALCCSKANYTGDISGAINELVGEIGHDKFYEIFTNLEVGSKYRANYRELVESMKEDVQQYLAHREEEKEIKLSAKITWLILLGFGGIAMYMAQGLGERNILNVLLENLLGKLLLGYSGIVVLYVIAQIFKSDGK